MKVPSFLQVPGTVHVYKSLFFINNLGNILIYHLGSGVQVAKVLAELRKSGWGRDGLGITRFVQRTVMVSSLFRWRVTTKVIRRYEDNVTMSVTPGSRSSKT